MALDPRPDVIQMAFTRDGLEAFLEVLNRGRVLSFHGCRLTFSVSFYESDKATFYVEEHCDGT